MKIAFPGKKIIQSVLFAIIIGSFASSVFAINLHRPDSQFKALLKQAIETDSNFIDRFDAEVWLLDMSKRLAKRAAKIPVKERMTLLKAVHREATRAKLDPQLVLSLIEIESRFDRFAVSKVGAQGLMQIMPFWKNEIGHKNDNLFDIDTNLRYGCAILSIYFQRENHKVVPALARYNGSFGRVKYSNKVLQTLRKHWRTGD